MHRVWDMFLKRLTNIKAAIFEYFFNFAFFRLIFIKSRGIIKMYT